MMSKAFDRPWPGRRGIETTDYNNGLLLARTSVEHLASEVGAHASLWRRDVLGAEVQVGRKFGWVFRLEGHAWTIFLSEDFELAGSPEELSARLSVPVIAYSCSDTMGYLAYTYATDGTARESLVLEDDEVEFTSELRSLEISSSNAFRVAEDFLREQDAYEPGIYPEYFFADGRTMPRLEPGQKLVVGNPGFILQDGERTVKAVPTFERVDYVAFEKH
jgi:hypothetical protein